MMREQSGYFPLFINIKDRKAVVIGGGKIASRRIRTLLQFGCDITVIAPKLNEELQAAQLRWIQRSYKSGDCEGACLVTTATDKRAVNHAVAEECRKKHIPVSVADSKEESSFYFPGIIKKEPLVIGVTASGRDHRLAAKTVKALKEWMAIKGEKQEVSKQ